MQRRVPDVRKIRKRIGWEPQVSLEKMLQRVIAFYRNGRRKEVSGRLFKHVSG